MLRLIVFLVLPFLIFAPAAAQPVDGCRAVFALLSGHSLNYLPFSNEPDSYGWPALGDDYFDKRLAKCYTENGGWIEVQESTAANRKIVFFFNSAAVSTDANGEHFGLHDIAGLYELVETQ